MAGMLDFAVTNAGNKLNSYLSNNYEPGAYGQMQGYLKAQEEGRAQSADIREERKLGMVEEKFGWERDDRAKEQMLQKGMAEAANNGGYEGVIAFLQHNDPERALKFHSAKESLDSQIMENDVMRNIKIPSMQQDALLDSYGKLGKMGAALIQAPAEFRDAMYEKMLPVAKLINPSMPDNLQEAAPMFLLAAAQATPANQLFKNDQISSAANSEIGKLDLDYRARLKAGVPSDDPTMIAIKNKIDAYGETAKGADAKAALARQQQISQIANQQLKVGQATEQLSKDIEKTSKPTMDYIGGYIKANSALKVLRDDPTNAAAQRALGLGFLKAAGNVGALSDKEQEMKYSAAGFPALWKKMHSLGGTIQDLNSSEISYLTNIIQEQAQQQLQYQYGVEKNYSSTTLKGFSGQIDWDKVRKPSKMLENYMYGEQMTELMASGQVPPKLLAQAQEAIVKGVDPKKVSAQLQQMMQGAKEKLQAQAPTSSPSDYAPTPSALQQLPLDAAESEANDMANEIIPNPSEQ